MVSVESDVEVMSLQMPKGLFGGKLVGIGVLVCAVASAWGEVDFSTQVRPILSDACFACHGPDENKRKADLRLDTKEGALSDRGGYPVIIPGDAEGSDLIARIVADDPDDLMPPPSYGKTLTPEQIAILTQWIAEGAQWQAHWAFSPIEQPPPPEISASERVRNPIDTFILARLEKEGLEPSPEADKEILLRRATFDLTGLPPSLSELDAFLADESPEAYERAVDRLLASPRYGEHRARYWLDAARYGDTHGLHLDNYREMWPYRDWVVRAFNGNKPFDTFIVEQLAGDLLDEPTEDQLIATGFNRCHVTTNEGGSIEEEVYVRNVVDRVVTTGAVFMGLTLDCTRCHDHKFDPLTMKDFYSLFAYFNSMDGPALDGNRKDPKPVINVPSAEQREKQAALTARIARQENRLKQDWPEVDALQSAWEHALRVSSRTASELVTIEQLSADILEAVYLEAEGFQAERFEIDGLTVSNLQADRIEAREFRAEGVQAQLARIRSGDAEDSGKEALAAVSLGDWYTVGPFKDNERYLRGRNHGPEGKPINLRDEFETQTGEKLKWKKRDDYADGKPHTDLPGDVAANFLYRRVLSPKAQNVEVSLGSDDGIRVYLNGKRVLNKLVRRGVAADQDTLELPLLEGENHLLLKILNLGGTSGYYFALKSEIQALPEAVYALALDATSELNDDQRAQLRAYYRNQVTDHADVLSVKQDLQTAREELNDLNRQIPTTLVYRERKEPREAFLLKRGEYDLKGDKVERRTPTVLPPMDGDLPNNRLGVARWLVDPEHPLTARVTVNRLWQQLFGTGLVKTSEDFGSQGEPPSHPRLLDWLAAQFIADGWDVKNTLKRMVMSATYRQSSVVRPEIWERDPENRLLARGPRFRLDGEMLRDQALYVSGLLEERIGGPSVKPPQPDGLWFAVGYSGSNTVRFKADEGDDKVHRRTLYTFIKRTSPPPQMSTFDAPSREACVMRRERTNTPMQALLLWNDPQYVEAARALAQRVLTEGGDTDADRAAFLFRIATGRQPNDAEVMDLLDAWAAEHEHYIAHGDAAEELIKAGGGRESEAFASTGLAAWMMTANLVLNLDEVIMKN